MLDHSRTDNPSFSPSKVHRVEEVAPSIVMIRHGKSAGNVISGKLRADPDMHFTLPSGVTDHRFRLTNTGRTQAAKTGEWLAERFPGGFDVIIASPFERAQQTAQIACEAAGWDVTKIVCEPLVAQRSWGDFYVIDSGTRGDIIRSFRKNPRDVRIPGGETLDETRVRAHQFLEKVRSEYAGKRVLVFSHGEFIREALADIGELSDDDRRFSVKNCQVFELSRRPYDEQGGESGGWLVQSHLPPGVKAGGRRGPDIGEKVARIEGCGVALPNLDSLPPEQRS